MKAIVLLFVVLLIPIASVAQVDTSSELYNTIRSNDSMLFNVGFNNGNIIPFETLLSDNFEMYHDEAGIMSSKTVFLESIKALGTLNYKPIRELVEHSLQVYPLENKGVLYGALETGEHRFYALEKDKPKYETSTAKFTHVWLLEDGKWKLSRVVSYDHKSPLGNVK